LRRFSFYPYENRRCAHSAAPPSRKKSRSARLFACKRAHDGLLSLPTFCGFGLQAFCIWIIQNRTDNCASRFFRAGGKPRRCN
jgi:hypothetical protein